MFHKFVKNKILAGLLLLSSLSYGENVHSDKSESSDNSSPDKIHQVSQNNTINVHGMKFYIPPEEPSWKEQKEKAVLMYWERKDPVTGKIIVTKYPDTLNVKEEVQPEHYTKEDLDLLLGADRARFYPEYNQLKQKNDSPAEKDIPNIDSTTILSENKTTSIQNNSKDAFAGILEDFGKENQNVTKEVKPSDYSITNLSEKNSIKLSGQQEVQELLDLIEQENQNSTNEIPVISTSINNTPVIQNQSTSSMDKVLKMIEEKEGIKLSSGPSATEMLQQTFDELIDSANNTNTISSTDKSGFISKTESPSSVRAGVSEVEELLNLLEKEKTDFSIPTNTEQQVKTDLKSEQSQENKQYTPPGIGYTLPLFLAPFAIVLFPDLKKKKPQKKPEEVKTPIISQAEKSEPITHKENEEKEKRDALSERLHAIRTIEDIKNQRRILSKQMRQAKKNNDTAQIQEITEKRKALSLKRREKCLCLTNPQMAIIKEKRRLLTKDMTIARRKKDIQRMNEITAERLELKNQVKEINASIRNFDYVKNRQNFLKESTVKLIQSHKALSR